MVPIVFLMQMSAAAPPAFFPFIGVQPTAVVGPVTPQPVIK